MLVRWLRSAGFALGVLGTLAALASACGAPQAPETTVSFKRLADVPQSAWDRLAQRKLYFGHQSVGDNLVAGVQEVLGSHPVVSLRIAKLDGAARFEGPEFLESRIGKNGDPTSKTDRFAELVEGGLAEDGAVLFHKYCYGDFWDPEGPKVDQVFERYKATMQRLHAEYPGVTFVHFTIPLGAPKLGLKTRVKKMMGGTIGEYANNIRNDEFNELMRKEYGGREPLFDLAQFESTRPDGTRETFRYRDRSYETLVPQFTNDDGHLNETGRRQVAEQFLVFLAELPATH